MTKSPRFFTIWRPVWGSKRQDLKASFWVDSPRDLRDQTWKTWRTVFELILQEIYGGFECDIWRKFWVYSPQDSGDQTCKILWPDLELIFHRSSRPVLGSKMRDLMVKYFEETSSKSAMTAWNDVYVFSCCGKDRVHLKCAKTQT